MGQYINKKVRITKGHQQDKPEYVGKIGIVVEEYSHILKIKMEDGEIIMPYAPHDEDSQCELIEEEDYTWNNLRGKKYAIEVVNEQEWIQVCDIMRYAEKRNIYHTAMTPEVLYTDMIEHDPKSAAIRKEYTIISASEFIKANTTTMENNIQSQIEQLKKEQQAIADKILKLEEEAKWKPKVGDWVYVMKDRGSVDYDGNNGGYSIGEVFCVSSKEKSELEGGDWLFSKNRSAIKETLVRKATPQEIEAATPKKKEVTIGEGTKITIEKGKITGPEGKVVTLSSIMNLVSNTIPQLQQVIDEYKKLNQ